MCAYACTCVCSCVCVFVFVCVCVCGGGGMGRGVGGCHWVDVNKSTLNRYTFVDLLINERLEVL